MWNACESRLRQDPIAPAQPFPIKRSLLALHGQIGLTMKFDLSRIRMSLLIALGLCVVLGVVFAVVDAARSAVLLLVVGVYLSIAVSMLWHLIERCHFTEHGQDLVAQVSTDRESLDFVRSSISSYMDSRKRKDPLYQEMFRKKVRELLRQLADASRGCIEYAGGETWRKEWQLLLGHKRGTKYLSVAWVKSPEYWSDPAGQESFAFCRTASLDTTRIYVLRDPCHDDPEVCRMVLDDYGSKVKVFVVLEDVVKASDEQLLADFGVYGTRAVGYQDLDDRCRTRTFKFYFDEEQCEAARERFNGLKLYATEGTTADYVALARKVLAEEASKTNPADG